MTNLIILEEAHHILARRSMDTKESVLETSIRMIRQYGIGYVFVDQSASLLSNVAFANSYATLALSQKLRADVQTMAGAMNLTEDQRDALSTLPIERPLYAWRMNTRRHFSSNCPAVRSRKAPCRIRRSASGWQVIPPSPSRIPLCRRTHHRFRRFRPQIETRIKKHPTHHPPERPSVVHVQTHGDP